MDNPLDPKSTKEAPVIVDMGTQSRKRIKKLRDGRGKLLRDINEVLETLKQDGTVKDAAQVVVVVVTKEPRDAAFDWFRGCE